MSDSLQPHGRSLPGSTVHGIFQAGILEWGAPLNVSSVDTLVFGVPLLGPCFCTFCSFHLPVALFLSQNHRVVGVFLIIVALVLKSSRMSTTHGSSLSR